VLEYRYRQAFLTVYLLY